MKIRYVLPPDGYVAVYALSQDPYHKIVPLVHWVLGRRGDPEQDDIFGMVALKEVVPADSINTKHIRYISYWPPTKPGADFDTFLHEVTRIGMTMAAEMEASHTETQ